MAKFRTNHNKQKAAAGGMLTKVGIFGGLVAALFFVFQQFGGNTTTVDEEFVDTYVPDDAYWPQTGGQLLQNDYFVMSYNKEHKQANWTAHILKREEIEMPWNERPRYFSVDKRTGSDAVTPDDYRGSGYDRGHLVPSADMAWNKEAMKETFKMSNVSPQARNFNQGIWRELEEVIRSWAKKYKQLYVVSGPVLTQPIKGTIGDNVSIPAAYFKVILDLSDPEKKGIAFVMPNEVSYEPLYEYAITIDEAEEITGIDFFPDLMTAELEEKLEGEMNKDLWSFNKGKFDKRVNSWNKVK